MPFPLCLHADPKRVSRSPPPHDAGVIERDQSRVVSLSGQSVSDVSYAVAPNNMTRAVLHVANALSHGAIGRVGRVTFKAPWSWK